MFRTLLAFLAIILAFLREYRTENENEKFKTMAEPLAQIQKTLKCPIRNELMEVLTIK